MTKPKRRRTTAEQEAQRLIARARDLHAVGMQPEGAVLPHQADIEVTRAGRKREGQKVTDDSARRLDAFGALKSGMEAGCYDAAQRLELDIRTRRGEAERGRVLERVDGDSGRDLMDRIVQAGQTIDWLKTRLSRRDFWLLHELIAPSREYAAWRNVVYYVTGEDQSNAQGAAVRAATINLRDAYAELDMVGRKAA